MTRVQSGLIPTNIATGGVVGRLLSPSVAHCRDIPRGGLCVPVGIIKRTGGVVGTLPHASLRGGRAKDLNHRRSSQVSRMGLMERMGRKMTANSRNSLAKGGFFSSHYKPLQASASVCKAIQGYLSVFGQTGRRLRWSRVRLTENWQLVMFSARRMAAGRADKRRQNEFNGKVYCERDS